MTPNYMVYCPFDDEREPSFHITEKEAQEEALNQSEKQGSTCNVFKIKLVGQVKTTLIYTKVKKEKKQPKEVSVEEKEPIPLTAVCEVDGNPAYVQHKRADNKIIYLCTECAGKE